MDGGLDSWWDQVREFPDEMSQALPRTVDRYWEAAHFAQLACWLPVEANNEPQANWYFGAHLAATLGLVDAAKVDFSNAGMRNRFKSSPIFKEFYRTPDDPDPVERDPLGFSRAYKELRNLRMHVALPLVVGEARLTVDDLIRHETEENPPKRWFLMTLVEPTVNGLRQSFLTQSQREDLNGYLRVRALDRITGQFLAVLSDVLKQTWKCLTV